MKLFKLVILCSLFSFNLFAADQPPVEEERMTQSIMQKIIEKMGTELKVESNVISFVIEKTQLFCVWDIKADRMRLVSPITDVKDLPTEFLTMALQANYHSVLDPRYAIGDGVLYSAFIHPLSPLTKNELESAILQVAIAANTFGTTFTSGALVFPGQNQQAEPKNSQPVL